MMKKLKYLFVLLPFWLGAQHLPHYSQYMLNDYAINQAWAGSKDYFDVKSNHRNQWVGITDAPRTYTLSAHGPLKNKNMGIGGWLYTDHVGPTRRTGIQLSYAYHIQVAEKTKVSLSLGAGLLQYMVDASKITLRDQGDPVIGNGLQSALVPDFAFGLLVHHEDYYFGVSLPQIIQNKLYFYDYQTETRSKLEDHYYVTGAYTFHITDDFDLQPGFLVKYVKPIPVQFDFTGRLIYKKQVWLGASYRTMDAIAIMTGYLYKENLLIGYSYDITHSNLGNYNRGTHEIMLGVRFVREKTFKP
ncbi:MAG: type IX secretion system membrane protein PorP/SprF [Flavobacteriales bacterium]